MKERFMNKMDKFWDKAVDVWEDTKIYALLGGIATMIGGVGFIIGMLCRKK